MANNSGINIEIGSAQIQDAVNRAIEELNKGAKSTTPLKLGVDLNIKDALAKAQSELNSSHPLKIKTELDISGAVKNIREQLADITSPKIGIGENAKAAGKNISANEVTSQWNNLNAIVKSFMKEFHIVRRTSDETAAQIKQKFTDAFSEVFEAKLSGDIAQAEKSMQGLLALTEKYTKTFKNPVAVAGLEELKSAFNNSIVPISEYVRKELDYLCDGRGNSRKFLNKAFGSRGWKMVKPEENGIGTDVWLAGIEQLQDGASHAADTIDKLAQSLIKLKEDARTPINIFDTGDKSIQDLTRYVDKSYELANTKKMLADASDIAAQKESNEQAAAENSKRAYQDYQTVLEKFENLHERGFGKILNTTPNDYMVDLSLSNVAVDALGRVFDRISQMPKSEAETSLRNVADALNTLRANADALSYDQLIAALDEITKSFDRIGTESEKNLKSANAAIAGEKAQAAAINQTAEAIKKKNSAIKNGSDTASVSKDAKPTITVSVAAKKIATSIKAAITEINKAGMLDGKNVKIGVSVSALKTSINKAISELNSSNAFENKTIKLPVKFGNVKQAVQDLKKQLAAHEFVVSARIRTAAASAKASIAESTKISDIGNAVKNNVKALKEEQQQIETNNQLLKVRQNYNLRTNDSKLYRTYGVSGHTLTEEYKNGVLESQTVVDDLEKIRKNAETAYSAASKLRSELLDIMATSLDKNANAPILNPDNISAVNSEISKTAAKINELEKASGDTFTKAKADAEAALKDLERMVSLKRNEEYAATSLRTKDIATIKAEQTNFLQKFISDIGNSKVPISNLEAEIADLKNLLNNVNDKDTLVKFLNELDIAKTKLRQLKSEIDQFGNAQNQISSDLKSLDRLSHSSAFVKNPTNDGVVKAQAEIEGLRNSYLKLQEELAASKSPEAVAKVQEKLTGLQEKLKETISSARELQNNLGDERSAGAMERKAVRLAIL